MPATLLSPRELTAPAKTTSLLSATRLRSQRSVRLLLTFCFRAATTTSAPDRFLQVDFLQSSDLIL